ncbi:HD domain-containing phosphohydrolase, partial [Acinetobacter baumannii]
QAQLAHLYLATIKTLALAIDAKDQYTHQHIVRVQRYAVAIAEEMGLDEMTLEAVRTGALLHDIGKLGVPEYVLLKPGRLTADEYEKIKLHPS